MGILIRSDAEPYEKVLGRSILTVIALSFAGFFSRFIPSEAYHFYSSVISLPIAIFIIFLTGYQIKRNKQLYIKQGKSYYLRWYTMPLFAILWLYFSYVSFTLGIPSLINRFIATNHQQTVTITNKTSGGSRRICSSRIHVKELKSVLSRALCTSYEFHASVELGDRLILTGRKSWMGITVEHFISTTIVNIMARLVASII